MHVHVSPSDVAVLIQMSARRTARLHSVKRSRLISRHRDDFDHRTSDVLHALKSIQRCLTTERSRAQTLKCEVDGLRHDNHRLRQEKHDCQRELHILSEQNMKLDKDHKDIIKAKDLKISFLETKNEELKSQCEKEKERLDTELERECEAAVDKYKKSCREELKQVMANYTDRLTQVLQVGSFTESSSSTEEDDDEPHKINDMEVDKVVTGDAAAPAG